ncbi:MAG: MMPL family transporter [Flavobacteriia bacterium]|nr:MMPL family transporter [Flavobacteriia bacterium]
MWKVLASLILRNRLFVLTVIALLTVFLGYYAVTSLKVDNRYGNTLPKDSPAQADYLKFKAQFGEDGSTLVIAVKSDSLYDKKNFIKWKELGDSILKFDGVVNVISEATLYTISNNIEQNRFEIRKIFSDLTFHEKTMDSIKKEIRRNPIYNKLLYNDDSKVSLIMIGMNEKALADKKKSKVVFQIEALAETYSKYFGKPHFAGLPHMRVVIGKRILNEMYIFLALSVFASSLLLYIFFRSLRVVIQCNIVVFVSVIWALGSIGLLGFKISIMMALIPPLMIVIGVPNCVFLVTRYHQEYVLHGNKIKALYTMIRRIGSVTFLTNLTTAVGFCTFTSSDKLAEFGIISSVNIMVVFVLSICIIPIIASFSKPPKPRHLKHLYRVYSKGFIEKIVHLVSTKRKWIYIGSVLLTIVSIYGMTKITATGNVTGDLPKDDPILVDLKFIEKNFGGSIPFEMTINYKEKGRLFKNETLNKVEAIQEKFAEDTLFSKSLSLVDFIKAINMAYYGNNPSQYKLVSNKDKLKLKKYIDKFDISSANGGNLSLKELVDTLNTTLRIRTQMKDLGSYQVAQKVDTLKAEVDALLNPDKKDIERLYNLYLKGKTSYVDSIIYTYSNVFNSVTSILSKGNDEVQLSFDMNPEKINSYIKKPYFKHILRKAIDKEYYDLTFTGTSVVVSEGTKYLFINLVQSLVFAILSIAALMAVLFRSFRIIMISMIPNVIPLLFTAGIMGYFQIPLKPSTLLVFGIALGITVDNAILFLAKYRQELKLHMWDIKYSILLSLRETGLGIFYTSVILFFGFIMFAFSQFGGTKALGMLVSLTILVGMMTNLIILPALLLSLERKITTKSFKEPFFDIYDEEIDYENDQLQVESTKKI